MFEARDPQAEKQNELWLVRDKLPQATAGTFYQKHNQTLDEIGFAQGAREFLRFGRGKEGWRLESPLWAIAGT